MRLAVLLTAMVLMWSPASAEEIDAAHAPVATETAHKAELRALSRSILKVTGVNAETMRTYTGTAVVIKVEDNHFIALTARHVVEGGIGIIAEHNDQRSIALEIHYIPNTDAAWVKFRSLKDIIPIKVDLSQQSGWVFARGFGYWGREGSENGELTGTIGRLNRSVLDAYHAPDMKLMRGVIAGSYLVYPGYSGGAVLDGRNRLIGINIILGSRSIAVDIRYIFNHLPWRSKESKLEYKIVNDFNLYGSKKNDWKRIAIPESTKFMVTSTVKKDGKKIKSIKIVRYWELVTIVNEMRASSDRNLSTNIGKIAEVTHFTTVVSINGKKYSILGDRIQSDRFDGQRGIFAPSITYGLMIHEGWELMLILKEIKNN
jgi:hypothetical protein